MLISDTALRVSVDELMAAGANDGARPDPLLALQVTAAIVRFGSNAVCADVVGHMLGRGLADEDCVELAAMGAIDAATWPTVTLTAAWIAAHLDPSAANQITSSRMSDGCAEESAAPSGRMSETVSQGLKLRISGSHRHLEGESYCRFHRFWAAYAHKEGKQAAARAWLELEDEAKGNAAPDLDWVIEAARREAVMRGTASRRGIATKRAAGWLMERRFEDECYADSPEAWTKEDELLLSVFEDAPDVEQWEIPTDTRKAQLRHALSQHPDLAWWKTFVVEGVNTFDWDPYRDRQTRLVPLAVVLNDTVVARVREHIRNSARSKRRPTKTRVRKDAIHLVASS